MQNGKGSTRRPKSVSQETWDKNWEAIFRPKKKKEEVEKRSENK